MAPIVIGLVGPQASGKDSIATILEHQHEFVRFAVADPMRGLAEELFPRYRETVADWGYDDAHRQVPYVREAVELVGAAGRQVFGKHFWADRLHDRIADFFGHDIVVTDVRYPAEYDELRYWDGYLVAVERPGHEPENDTIATLMLRATHGIINDGTLDDLAYKVDVLITELSK